MISDATITGLLEHLNVPEPYNPYSGFPVTAMVETKTGSIHMGVNVENASYTLTKHAEEVAILQAIMGRAIEKSGREFLETIVLFGKDLYPCGICRQFIQEFAHEDTVFIQYDTETQTSERMKFSDLLPNAFGPKDLGVET